jgi:hypothetical protein
LALQRRLTKGLTAKTEVIVRRWLAQLAMELNQG